MLCLPKTILTQINYLEHKPQLLSITTAIDDNYILFLTTFIKYLNKKVI